MTSRSNQLVLLGVLAALAACEGKQTTSAADPNLYHVTREDLPITVKEGGELIAVRQTIVRSEVEGQATIIYLVPEGTAVKKGDKLVELDVSDLVEKRATQEINVGKAQNAWEQARTESEILEKELTTKRNTAASQLKIAEMELEKLLGAKGNNSSEGTNNDMVLRLRELTAKSNDAARAADASTKDLGAPAQKNLVTQVDPSNYSGLANKAIALLQVEGEGNPLERDMGEMSNQILQQVDKIRLAMADLKVKEDTVAHSRRLAAKQFITRNELERDELAYQSQASSVTIAWNDLDLLINYTLQKDRIKLSQDLANAKLELERVDASNDAERKKSLVDVEAKEKELKVATERLENLNKQIGNAICYAPTPGLVVYARVDRDRRGGDSIKEGLQVRERQDLIILPDNTKMRCNVKVQEAFVDQVEVGQPVRISVEAFPNEILTGRVTRVAPVADSSNSWMGNDKKVYTTVIDIDGENNDSRLRTQMAASATITVGTVPHTIAVPQQAVRRDRSVNYVWKRTEQGPIAVPVKIGSHNQEKVEILDGVTEGDVVYRTPPGGKPDPKFDQPVLPDFVPMKDDKGAAGEPTKPGASGSDTPGPGTTAANGGGRQGGNRQGGGMGAMRKKFAEMTPEEIQQSRQMYAGMLDRFRDQLSEEQATALEKAIGDMEKAIDANDLEQAQKLRDGLRALMPRRNPGQGGQGQGGQGQGGQGQGGPGGGGPGGPDRNSGNDSPRKR